MSQQFENQSRRDFLKQSLLASAAYASAAQPTSTGQAISIRPDWDGKKEPFRHTWEGLLNIDQFRWMVRRDVQDQLRMAHDELGGRHVRAVGMFDDEMRVVAQDPAKWRNQGDKTHVNWQIVDYVIGSLLNLGINPMYTTTFMPGLMAAGERTTFSTKARISPPKDYKEWRSLVTGGVRHAVELFGRSTVGQWYFEVWNEPNLMNGFWEGTQADFFRLWATTYRAIKTVDSSFRVGGPSTARGEWLRELIEFGRKNDCSPDYIITHIYNNDSDSNPLSPFDGPQEDKVSKSPHFASGLIRGCRRLLDELGFKGEVHWNEWGRSWYPCYPPRETASEAAFVVKTMAEVSQLADYFAYWCLSDVYDQVGYGAETFHGNYGLLNLQGLRKPPYHAFQLLGRLDAQRCRVEGEGLDRMTNAIATTSPTSRHILVYSYVPDSERQPVVSQVQAVLPAGAERKGVVLFRVSSQENNILRIWQDMGSPTYLRREQLEQLKSENTLKPARGAVKIQEGIASFSMESPGVALLEIEV
ncbi:MAG: hypothetical protein EHM61_24945 [Acidobacteria bacterium]|nr:MAG: hypothetical protein EHM61_24945 [Acidobacteriota bacterium]